MTSIGTTEGSPFDARVDDGNSCRCPTMLEKLSQPTFALAVRVAFVGAYFYDIGLPSVVSRTPSPFPRSLGVR
jgi:glucose/arabinose dehydrogenase